MFVKRTDPIVELLRPPLNFGSEEEQIAHLRGIGEALAWVDDLSYPVLIADGMVQDFPTVAVSEGFLRESHYPRNEVLFRNCNFLQERVTGREVYRISRSENEKMRAFCKLSRYPGAVGSKIAIQFSQPNVLGDGSCVTNHAHVFRVYACGYPFLITLPNFGNSVELSAELERLMKERGSSLTMQIADSDSLKEKIEPFTMHDESKGLFDCSRGLYRGDNVSPSLLFFCGGRGVLRQEPQLLPQSGTIFAARPVPLQADGSRRISLRLNVVMPNSWPDVGGPPMGFTLTPPESEDLTESTKLQFVGCTIGFTCVGPMVNTSPVALEGNRNWREHLDIFPMESFPEPHEGDIVTVEITSNGELKRYRNGILLHMIATNRLLEDEQWYGAFEIAMNIASATLLDADPFLEDTESAKQAQQFAIPAADVNQQASGIPRRASM